MKILTTIKNIIIIFMLVCIATAIIDFIRIKNVEAPIFCIKKYDPIQHILYYRGLFYRAERRIKNNINEKMDISEDVSYTFIVFKLKVNYPYKKDILERVIYIKNNECTNFQKYVEQEDLTIYTNCIEKIKIREEKSLNDLNDRINTDPTIINSIINDMSFMGMINPNTEKYNSNNNSNKEYTIYHCMDNNIYYITKQNYYTNDICLNPNI